MTTLHERGRLFFRLADVVGITGQRPESARTFVGKLVKRGVATRLHSGLYILVPAELGRERDYLGNPYAVAREFMAGKPYYLSHASALEIHGLLTQPQLVVTVSSPAALRGRTVLGTEFRFVRCKASDVFGTTGHWIDKREQVQVSDLERTIIDGLKMPEYCGGLTEVAKGVSLRRTELNPGTLVAYALRLGVGAVIRRLGYLMETFAIGTADELAPLRQALTPTYCLLDPLLPPEGTFLARWRIRLNVSPEELKALGST